MLLPRPQGAHLFPAQLARLEAAGQAQDLAVGAPAKDWDGWSGNQRWLETGIQMGFKMGLRTRSRWYQGGLRMEMGSGGRQHEMRGRGGACVQAEDPVNHLSLNSPGLCTVTEKDAQEPHTVCEGRRSLQRKALPLPKD